MKVHELKIQPDFFDEIWKGNKTCEIRLYADHDFQKGDLIKFKNYHCDGLDNHKIMNLEITHITVGYGLKENFVALSFKILSKYTERKHKLNCVYTNFSSSEKE